MDDFKIRKTIAQEELKECAEFWKYTLGLSDWNIAISIDREKDMTEQDCAGYCKYRTVRKEAVISIVDPIDWESNDFEYDMEKTLVHELLHCKFALIDSDDSLREVVQHRLLDEIATAIVLAYRSDRK